MILLVMKLIVCSVIMMEAPSDLRSVTEPHPDWMLLQTAVCLPNPRPPDPRIIRGSAAPSARPGVWAAASLMLVRFGSDNAWINVEAISNEIREDGGSSPQLGA